MLSISLWNLMPIFHEWNGCDCWTLNDQLLLRHSLASHSCISNIIIVNPHLISSIIYSFAVGFLLKRAIKNLHKGLNPWMICYWLLRINRTKWEHFAHVLYILYAYYNFKWIVYCVLRQISVYTTCKSFHYAKIDSV